jgi:hypothetical protein
MFYFHGSGANGAARSSPDGNFRLNFSQAFQTCERFTRCKLLGKQLAGAKSFAADLDECRHFVRIFHGP